MIEESLFKSIMVVSSSITAAVVMKWHFKNVKDDYTREAVITGTTWLALNWGLDYLMLIQLFKMPPIDYVMQIGVRYLMIPTTMIAVGMVADDAIRKQSKGN